MWCDNSDAPIDFSSGHVMMNVRCCLLLEVTCCVVSVAGGAAHRLSLRTLCAGMAELARLPVLRGGGAVVPSDPPPPPNHAPVPAAREDELYQLASDGENARLCQLILLLEKLLCFLWRGRGSSGLQRPPELSSGLSEVMKTLFCSFRSSSTTRSAPSSSSSPPSSLL